MIEINDSDRKWYQRAVQSYGPMTCPECFGKIEKDRMTNAYYCEFCGAYFDAQTISEQHVMYNRFLKMKAQPIPKPQPQSKYVVYAEGTWSDSRALFRRHGGSASYSYEADAETFSYEQAKKIVQTPARTYKWKAKKVS